MENPIIEIAAKFQDKIPSLRSHGLEVVRIEIVVLSYKDLELRKPRRDFSLQSSDFRLQTSDF